jgi:exodeoxyribonuclease III
MTKIISWNVNGIRAAAKNGFLEWFETQAAEIVCVQEIKAYREQLDFFLQNPSNVHSFWHSAQKPGYSGVAVFTRTEPLRVVEGLGVPEIDAEGRVLQLEFADFTVLNAYFPNSQRDHARLPYKLKFCQEMLKRCQAIRAQGKNLILCGDFNIAHHEIDLKNPKTNQDNAGFLPEERAWMDEFISAGYVDAFRKFHPNEPGHYTWWSYRPGVREKNIGWRLDYHCTNFEFGDRLESASIQSQVRGSDHCPVVLEFKV